MFLAQVGDQVEHGVRGKRSIQLNLLWLQAIPGPSFTTGRETEVTAQGPDTIIQGLGLETETHGLMWNWIPNNKEETGSKGTGLLAVLIAKIGNYCFVFIKPHLCGMAQGHYLLILLLNQTSEGPGYTLTYTHRRGKFCDWCGEEKGFSSCTAVMKSVLTVSSDCPLQPHSRKGLGTEGGSWSILLPSPHSLCFLHSKHLLKKHPENYKIRAPGESRSRMFFVKTASIKWAQAS